MSTALELASEAEHHTFYDDVILASNPEHESGWAQRTGLAPADISSVASPVHDAWSVGCNLAQIGPGTMAWIARYAGSGKPELGGFLVPDAVPASDPTDPDEWYVEGLLCGFAAHVRVSGAAIVAAGWARNQAPFGDKAQFTAGRRVWASDLAALVAAMDPMMKVFVADQFEKVNGSPPHWA